MAVTESQNNGDGILRFATGRYVDTGTAAAFDRTCGFRPRYVRVQNVTSGDGMEWIEGMADASAVKQVAAGDKTIITTLGITPLVDGFTIGLDTDVNVTSETVEWYALG